MCYSEVNNRNVQLFSGMDIRTCQQTDLKFWCEMIFFIEMTFYNLELLVLLCLRKGMKEEEEEDEGEEEFIGD